jgi:hypothetical protein
MPDAIITSNGNHLAVVAATRTSRDARGIEQLPFDLSALEEEGVFINVDAAGFGILDRRLDWEALGVELPQNTDVAFTVQLEKEADDKQRRSQGGSR